MENRERLNVYFEMEGNFYMLFQVVNIGKKNIPDFKFTGFSNLYINYRSDNNKEDDKGYLSEEEIDKSTIHSYIEFTYHKDGSFLIKNMDFEDKSKRNHNPYGIGARWTPINDIQDIQSVISIAIRRMEIYQPVKLEEEGKMVHNYICKNAELFERNGQYLVAIYMKEKNKPIACFTTSQGYSDILCNINDKLDLCILFQRHSYPKAKPYYSKCFGGWITPYLNNSITFCNKDTSIDELNNKMKNVFDPSFSEFVRIMGEGHIVNLSEEKLKIIDVVDKVYLPVNNGTNMTKPLFIKHLLNSISDFRTFNSKSENEKEDYVRTCYLLVLALPLMMTRKHEVEKILYGNNSNQQKLNDIRTLLDKLLKTNLSGDNTK